MFRQEKISFGKVKVYLLYYGDFIVEEYLSELLPHEVKRLEGISHNGRKREYIATRMLRNRVFGKTKIEYSEIGAPSLPGYGYISISHANNVVGVAHCPDYMVGFDLEPIHEKVMRVKHKFLSEEEKGKLDTSSIEEMIKVWSAKEALYKLAGRKGIIFAESLLLTKVDDELWHGKIYFEDKKREVDLSVIIKDNFVVSINPSPMYEV